MSDTELRWVSEYSDPGANGWNLQYEAVTNRPHVGLFSGRVVPERTLGEDAVKADLIRKAQGSDFDVPTFIGEGRETVKMIASTARTIASAYRDLRRGNLIGALGSLGIQGTSSQRRRYYREYGVDPTKAAANAWLAYTYGWKPLVQSVHDAAETLADEVNKPDRTELRVRSSKGIQYELNDTNHLAMASPQVRCTSQATVRESVRGIWRFKPTSLDSWGSFGLLNPALVAWELLPFSFVVDWFLPVGRYLEGLDTSLRFDHLGGTIGYRKEMQEEMTAWRSVGESQVIPISGSRSNRYVYVNRVPLTSAPQLSLSSISFEPKLGASRVTSAISLMRQAFGR